MGLAVADLGDGVYGGDLSEGSGAAEEGEEKDEASWVLHGNGDRGGWW